MGRLVHRLWGSSESNIWGVGPWGTIVHFDGKEWKKVDFDTEMYFYDISGNKANGIAYAIARNSSHVTKIIELNNESAKIVYNNEKNVNEFGSWTLTFESGEIYLADTKIWSFNPITKEKTTLYKLPYGVGILDISSNSKNDIYYWGSTYQGNDKLIHFNGNRYKVFEMQLISDNHGGSFAVNNMGIRVGFADNKAFLTMVRRIAK